MAAAILEGDTEDVAAAFETLVSSDLTPVSDYNTPFVFLNVVAEIAARILTVIPREDLAEKFANWHRAADNQLARSRVTVARIASRSPDSPAGPGTFRDIRDSLLVETDCHYQSTVLTAVTGLNSASINGP